MLGCPGRKLLLTCVEDPPQLAEIIVSDLTFTEYQSRAQDTDHLVNVSSDAIDPRLLPMLGLVGEAGTLTTKYKKHLRDGTSYQAFEQQIEEELGDVLWYLANTTEKFGLSLEGVAARNLEKASDRWPSPDEQRVMQRSEADLFDASFAPAEQLPRRFEVTVSPVEDDSSVFPTVAISWEGEPVVDRLRDNTYDDTGYRFHDVFHLANAAVLGWSPVSRKIFNRKRRSNPVIDDVEDGGRSIVIEEAVAALIFTYGQVHNYLEGVTRLDYHILKACRSLTTGLEVNARKLWEVEEAIMQGFAAWRQLREHNGGVLTGDLLDCSLTFSPAGEPSKT